MNASLAAAQEMTVKYGPPDEVTARRLIWHWRLPWKRIEVVKPGFPHMWPSPHMDVVSQTIPYRVPPDRFSALTFYDGSVYAERTAGELTARCGGEKMNLVALNLAHDVITKRRTVEQARREYERLAQLVGRGTVPAYAAALQFTPQYDHAGDPDVAVAGLGAESRQYAAGEQPVFDVWSMTHSYVGSVYGVSGFSWQTALFLAVFWEVVENPLKDRYPIMFPDSKHDSYPNALGDVGAVMLGWWLGSKL